MELLRRLGQEHEVLITVEEGSIGGFASQVMTSLASQNMLGNGLKIKPMTIPDIFIDHDTPSKQYSHSGLIATSIVKNALSALGRDYEELTVRA